MVRGQRNSLYRPSTTTLTQTSFYLPPTQKTATAKSFLGKGLTSLKDWEKPTVINTGKAPPWATDLVELEEEGKCPTETLHRQVNDLINAIEIGHYWLKQTSR